MVMCSPTALPLSGQAGATRMQPGRWKLRFKLTTLDWGDLIAAMLLDLWCPYFPLAHYLGETPSRTSLTQILSSSQEILSSD